MREIWLNINMGCIIASNLDYFFAEQELWWLYSIMFLFTAIMAINSQSIVKSQSGGEDVLQ
jgi:FtsH-binding integral membrane protein